MSSTMIWDCLPACHHALDTGFAAGGVPELNVAVDMIWRDCLAGARVRDRIDEDPLGRAHAVETPVDPLDERI